MLPINVGVYSCSVLGPLLCINYLQSKVVRDIAFFAFGKCLRNIQPHLTSDLDNVYPVAQRHAQRLCDDDAEIRVCTARVLKLAPKL